MAPRSAEEAARIREKNRKKHAARKNRNAGNHKAEAEDAASMKSVIDSTASMSVRNTSNDQCENPSSSWDTYKEKPNPRWPKYQEMADKMAAKAKEATGRDPAYYQSDEWQNVLRRNKAWPWYYCPDQLVSQVNLISSFTILRGYADIHFPCRHHSP